MRLTRHAKNRLRLIARRVPAIDESRFLKALDITIGSERDVKGNRKLIVQIDAILLRAIVDDQKQIVITIWREE